MRTDWRSAATVSSSSASPCVAEMTPPGWLLRSTPWIIMPRRSLCTAPALRSLFRVEAGRGDRHALGVGEQLEGREGAVSRPLHPILLEDLVESSPPVLAKTVGA